MEIIKAPNIILSEKAKHVHQIDQALLSFVGGMKKTLLEAKDPEGVGLAAPQVGKSLQIFIIKPTVKSPISVYINPQVTLIEEEKRNDDISPPNSLNNQLEGCLSLQNIWGTVKRSSSVKITYQDENNITHTKTYKGFVATILQHEYDHLNGILFPKRVLEQKGKLYKSKKGKDGKDIFEELDL